MQKTTWILLALVMLINACAPVSVAPTLSPTATLRGLPSPTATIRPTPSPTPTPRPVGVDEIAHLGGKLKNYAVFSSPDGKTYIIVDDSGLHLYDSESKKEIRFFTGEQGGVRYSSNSQMIVIMTGNATKLIQLSDGKVLGEFKVGYESMPNAFSPDSKRFAYLIDCSEFYEPECKETIHVWDVATQQDVFEIKAQSVIAIFEFRELAFDPTGAFLLASDSKGVIHVWNASNGKAAFNLSSPTGGAASLVFSHDGKYLATFDDDKRGFQILLWNWNTKERRTFTGKHDDFIRNIDFSADDSQINLIFLDDSTLVLDLASGKLSQGENFIDQDEIRFQQMREQGEYIASPESIAYSPDGQTLAVSSRFLSPIILWDLHKNKVRATLDGKATHLEYNHRGNRLIVLKDEIQDLAGEDADLSVWDVEHNVKLYTVKIPWATTFDISPDDSILAINSFHAIQLWGIEKGTLIQSLATPGLLESPFFVSYNVDGKSINTVLLKDLGQREYELSVRSWDASTGDLLPTPIQPIHLGNADGPIALHHDTLALFQYLPDSKIVLWDVKSGKKLQTITIDAYHPPDVFFTPDDQVMVLPDANQVTFYNVQTGFQIYKTVENNEAEYRTAPLAFRRDGNQLAIGDNNGSIYLWDISHILAAALHPQP